MKNSHTAKTAITFALALSIISGCNNNVAENQTAQTPNTKKVVSTNNGYITGEPVAYKTENNNVTGQPAAYNQNYNQFERDFAAIPDDNVINPNPNPNFNQNIGMLDGNPNFVPNTDMLDGNPNFNQAAPTPKTPSTPQKAQPAPSKQTPSTSKAPGDTMVQQVVQLTNEQRRKNGLSDLKVDIPLTNMAQKKAQDMLDNSYFSHTSPTYGSPFDMMKTFGISYRSAGENIAKGQPSAQQVVNDWMNSPGHRANILNSGFTHIGVGHTTSEGYWTQEFISK